LDALTLIKFFDVKTLEERLGWMGMIL